LSCPLRRRIIAADSSAGGSAISGPDGAGTDRLGGVGGILKNNAYAPSATTGEVKIVNAAKDALVYVDGGYAGTVGKLKKFPLRPGNHDIELRDPSGHGFHQVRIHVIPGKTLEIDGGTGGH
jgi:hypothetical protein